MSGRGPVLQSAEAQPAAEHRTGNGARTVVQAWLASRGLIALVALVLAVVEGRTLTDMVSNWDVQHFVRLAEGGYRAEPDNILMAFFPGLPVLLSLFAEVGIPMAISGVIISTICSGIAAAALYRLGGTWAAVAWLFAPTAVFTTVPYTESLFCAAAFWAWERARSGRWLAAAGLCAVACTVRVSGLFLLGALVVMIITEKADARTRLRRLGLMIIPAAVLGAYASYLYLLTGSWTAWYTAQTTGWVRGFTWPWQSFLNTLPIIKPGAYADHPWWAAVFRGEMISMFVGLGVVVWCLVVTVRARVKSRPEPVLRQAQHTNQHTAQHAAPVLRQAQHANSRADQHANLLPEASWVGVQVLAFSLSYWFFSVNRATLLWFPLWMMLGRWVGRTSPGLRGVPKKVLIGLAFGLEITLMVWWSWLFFTGHWAS